MIIHNRVRCKKCDTVIESKSVHDFVWCECTGDRGQHNGVAVDGGKDYIRRVGDLDQMEELSEFDDDKVELLETDSGKKSVEITGGLIIGMDEEPETEKTLEEKLEMLSPKDRLIYEQKLLIQQQKEMIALYEKDNNLVEEVRKTIGGAARVLKKKDMVIREGDELKTSTMVVEFDEEWVALPRANHELVKVILAALGKESK